VTASNRKSWFVRRTGMMNLTPKGLAAIFLTGTLVLALTGCGAGAPGGTLTDQQGRTSASGIAPGLGQQSGIHVTGEGAVSTDPDLVLLTLGVETRAATVEAARTDAAEAMNRVMDALRQEGVAEGDIQTRYFTIQPEYRYDTPQRVPVLVGYLVANIVIAKVRDVDAVGAIIDAVVLAGGDATRI
jgi:uncharacterized protein